MHTGGCTVAPMGAGNDFLAHLGRHVAERNAEISRRIVDRTYRSVPGYAGVPRDDFLARTEATFTFALGVFASGRFPTEDEFAFDRETIRQRLREGVRAKDWIAHGRVFVDVLREEASRFGREHGYPEAEVLAGTLQIEEVGHAAVAYAGEEFERAADELLQEDEARRRRFIADLLHGALPPAAMRSGATAIGLDPAGLYRSVRIRPASRADAGELLRRVLRSEPTVAPRGAWAALDDDVCGISQDGAPPVIGDATAGVGPAVPLEAVASSYTVASTALETACSFGLQGPHAMEDLGVLPLVAAGGRTGEALVERFVDRVQRSGSGGEELVATVEAFLARGMQVRATAQALHLHPNSLRKRLRRYEQLTGADLGSIEDLAAVWFALKRRAMEATPVA